VTAKPAGTVKLLPHRWLEHRAEDLAGLRVLQVGGARPADEPARRVKPVLVDELDQDVPPGEPGLLVTRGPCTPRGHYRAAEQNARAFTADGWYCSGDICRLTPDGNLIVEGRDKDMINRGGEEVSAEEVENLVYRLPAVSQVAAVSSSSFARQSS